MANDAHKGSKPGSSSAINLNLESISVARFRCAFARALEKQLDQIAPIYPESPGLFDDPKDWEEPQGRFYLPRPERELRCADWRVFGLAPVAF